MQGALLTGIRHSPGARPQQSILADPHAEVSAFLSSLNGDQRERFLAEASNRDSIYQLWLYASALGYEGDFLSLEAWQKERYPRLNRRITLTAEAVSVQQDIARIRSDDNPDTRLIASLTKELRGHLVEIEKMERGQDRRGLLLAGADRLLRILQDSFADDPDMLAVLEDNFEVFHAQLKEER